MSSTVVIIGSGLALLPADADPNVVAPPADRIFALARRASEICWATAEGGSPTVELWYFLDFADLQFPAGFGSRWFRWANATFALVQDQLVAIGQVPSGVPNAFLRVTVPNGATRIAFGTT